MVAVAVVVVLVAIDLRAKIAVLVPVGAAVVAGAITGTMDRMRSEKGQ